jgi:uncharacterized circularly permuted ATP-grasp superfamily protein
MSKVPKIDLGFLTKTYIQEQSGQIITDAQWEAIIDEIEGRFDNWLDQVLPDIYQDIEEGIYDD